MLEGGREEPEDHANSILQHTLAGHDAYHCIAAASSMHQGSVSHSHLTLSSSRATASHSHTSLSAVQFPFGVATVFVVAAAGGPPRDCSHHPSCASCCSSFCAARTCQMTLKHLSNPEKRSQSQTVTHPMNSSSRKPHGVAASGDMRFWMRKTATSKLQGMPQPPKRSARLPSALQRLLQRQQRGEQMRMCCLAGIGPAPHLPERQPTAMDRLQSPRRLQLQLQQQRLQPRGPRLQSVRPRRRLWRKC